MATGNPPSKTSKTSEIIKNEMNKVYSLLEGMKVLAYGQNVTDYYVHPLYKKNSAISTVEVKLPK